jgi:hypothetical protein
MIFNFAGSGEHIWPADVGLLRLLPHLQYRGTTPLLNLPHGLQASGPTPRQPFHTMIPPMPVCYIFLLTEVDLSYFFHKGVLFRFSLIFIEDIVYGFFFLHCFICRPSDFTVSEYAGIEPRTVATSALAVRRCNHSARSHPHSARSHPRLARSYQHSARSHPHSDRSHPQLG